MREAVKRVGAMGAGVGVGVISNSYICTVLYSS